MGWANTGSIGRGNVTGGSQAGGVMEQTRAISRKQARDFIDKILIEIYRGPFQCANDILYPIFSEIGVEVEGEE